MTVIALPKSLTDKLGDEGTQALIDILDKLKDNTKDNVIEIAENKFEKRLAEELGKVRAEIIKWMFIFWVGQAVTTIGITLTILK